MRLPYPGLRPFTREESDLFFGREGCVDAMVDRLAETRFLAVLGSSGSGKSSLVNTGLLDALELGLFARAGSRWAVAQMRPGGQPIRNLARALLDVQAAGHNRPGMSHDVERETLAAYLYKGPRSIVEWCRQGKLEPGTNLLILVDQFEELFRYGDYAGREEAEAFVALLLEAAQSPEFPIHIVLTMRSEFIGACALIPGLAERINSGLYLTPRMTREQMRETIEGPASVCGFSVEPALVNRLLNDLASFAPWEDDRSSNQLERLARRADQLPLMQHVLNRLWSQSPATAAGSAPCLRLSEYESIGGLRGALNAHADEVVHSLNADDQPLVEPIFRALVGGSSIANAVRRPCRFGDLVEIAGGNAEAVRRVVDAFRAPECNFLTPPSSVPIVDGTIIDISHESLIRQWSMLSDWFLKEAQAAADWRRLAADAEAHAKGKGGLLSGLDLANMQTWWSREKPSATWAARYDGSYAETLQFLERSAANENTQAEEKRAQRRQLLQLRWGLAGAVVIALIGVSAMKIEEQRTQYALNVKDLENSRKMVTQLRLTNARDKEDSEKEKAKAENIWRDISSHCEANEISTATCLALHQEIADLEKNIDESNAFRTKNTNSMISFSAHTSRPSNAQAEVNVAAVNALSGQHQAAASGQSQQHQTAASAADGSSPRPTDDHSQSVEQKTISKTAVARLTFEVTPAQIAVIKKEYERNARDFHDSESKLHALGSAGPPATLATRYLESGYLYAWMSWDIGDNATGDAVFRDLLKFSGRYAKAPIADNMRLPLAKILNLQSTFYWQSGRKAKAENFLRAGLRTLEPLIARKDASVSVLRLAYTLHSNASTEKFRAAGCPLALRMRNQYPNDPTALSTFAQCLQVQSSAAVARHDYKNALDLLREGERSVARALHAKANDQDLLLAEADILNDEANVAGDQNDYPGKTLLDRKAAAAFVEALKDRPFALGNLVSTKNLYFNLTAIDFTDDNDQLIFYADLARVLRPLAAAFPKSTNIAFMASDAQAHIGSVLVSGTTNDDLAQSYLGFATDEIVNGAVMRNPSEYSEYYAQACGAFDNLADLYGRMKKPDLLLVELHALRENCDPVLASYPWDYYLRQHFFGSAARAGGALFDMKRYAEARPQLEYASHWGSGGSSLQLAEMYRKSLGGLSRDDAKAAALESLADKQTLRRIDLQADFDGVKYPFFVYVRQWPTDYKYADGRPIQGIDDQITWLKEARGGSIDPKVAKKYRDLQKRARKNNLSFPELAAADADASKARQESAAKKAAEASGPVLVAIMSDLHKGVDFPKPQISTDLFGVAIRGYDPVAYFTKGRPVAGRPEFYLLSDGAIWLFSSRENRARFQADPEKYMPAFGGYCSYCMAQGDKVHGDPNNWVVRSGRLYLHATAELLAKWNKSPDKFIKDAQANWPRLAGELILPGDEAPLSDQLSKVATHQDDTTVVEGRLLYAETVLRAILKRSPKDPETTIQLTRVLTALAYISEKRKDYPSAIVRFKEAAGRYCDRYQATNTAPDRAQCEEALGELASADDDANDHAAVVSVDQRRVPLLRKSDLKDAGAKKLLASVLSNLSWHALFTRQFVLAKTSADEAFHLEPQDLVPATNAAHARMFLGDAAGAKKIYLAHRGQAIEQYGRWERAVLADFAQFRAAKLGTPPLMTEIEAEFSKSRP